MGSYFLYHHYENMQVNGDTHGVKWMSVGNDGLVETVFLYPMYSYVLFRQFRGLRANEVFDLPTL